MRCMMSCLRRKLRRKNKKPRSDYFDRSVVSVCRKRYWSCTNYTKNLGELLCPKRSTGTFWRLIKVRAVKRGSGRGRSPSKCFRISHPLLRFLEAKGDFAVCGQRRGAPPLDPATFEKVDETFTFVFICATFFILLLFRQIETTE